MQMFLDSNNIYVPNVCFNFHGPVQFGAAFSLIPCTGVAEVAAADLVTRSRGMQRATMLRII